MKKTIVGLSWYKKQEQRRKGEDEYTKESPGQEKRGAGTVES